MIHVILAVCIVIFTAGCNKETLVAIGEKAPEISTIDLNDHVVKLSDFSGKVVMLRFWSNGCASCVGEMPEIDKFMKSYRGKGSTAPIVIAVNVGDSKEVVARFVKKLKISYQVLLDPANIVANKYRITAIPTTFFIDGKGTMRKFVTGKIEQQELKKILDEI